MAGTLPVVGQPLGVPGEPSSCGGAAGDFLGRVEGAVRFAAHLLAALQSGALPQWAQSADLAPDAICAVLGQDEGERDIIYSSPTELAEDSFGFTSAAIGFHGLLSGWRFTGCELISSSVVRVHISLSTGLAPPAAVRGVRERPCTLDVALSDAGARCVELRPGVPGGSGPQQSPDLSALSLPSDISSGHGDDVGSVARRIIAGGFDALRRGSVGQWAAETMGREVTAAVGKSAPHSGGGTEAALRYVALLREVCGSASAETVTWHPESFDASGPNTVSALIAISVPRREVRRRRLQLQITLEGNKVSQLTANLLTPDQQPAVTKERKQYAVPCWVDESSLDGALSDGHTLPSVDPVALAQEVLESLVDAVESGTVADWAENALTDDVLIRFPGSPIRLQGRVEYCLGYDVHIGALGGQYMRAVSKLIGFEVTGRGRVRAQAEVVTPGVHGQVGSRHECVHDLSFRGNRVCQMDVFVNRPDLEPVPPDVVAACQDLFRSLLPSLESGTFAQWCEACVTEDVLYTSSHPRLGHKSFCGKAELSVHFGDIVNRFLCPTMKVHWDFEDAWLTGPLSVRMRIKSTVVLPSCPQGKSTNMVHDVTLRGGRIHLWRALRVFQEVPLAGLPINPVLIVRTQFDRFFRAVDEGTVDQWIEDMFVDDCVVRTFRPSDGTVATGRGKEEVWRNHNAFASQHWVATGAVLAWRPEWFEATGRNTVRALIHLTVTRSSGDPVPPRMLVYDIELRGERICSCNTWVHYIAAAPPTDVTARVRTIFDRYFRAMADGTMAQWAAAAMTDDVLDVVHTERGDYETHFGREEFCLKYNSNIKRLGPGVELTWKPIAFVQTSPNSVRAVVVLVVTPSAGAVYSMRLVYDLVLRAGRVCRRELWQAPFLEGEGGTGILVSPRAGPAAALAAAVAVASLLVASERPPSPYHTPRTHSPHSENSMTASVAAGIADDSPGGGETVGHVSFERPCRDNNWDSMRIKRGWVILRCRECGAQWRIAAEEWRVKRCPEFMAHPGSCAGSCGMLHVHRRRLNLAQRQGLEQHK
eukprot:TRINITY_DN3345_c0_g1_i1.p1 TRINITY_DN3345_c0_g1~~TRINITY_DN3345_c0_g1_i1.p1  ORF type:complete len:1083 (+),score=296.49 TRINITY_DN3345_c0_g1_i1:113-3250(+)